MKFINTKKNILISTVVSGDDTYIILNTSDYVFYHYSLGGKHTLTFDEVLLSLQFHQYYIKTISKCGELFTIGDMIENGSIERFEITPKGNIKVKFHNQIKRMKIDNIKKITID